ncbi:MAG TPA: cytochrome c nitrite reductase small subunit [Armatimonadota bacterium]|jgi:cytochrome c nitrite reductase small subunit
MRFLSRYGGLNPGTRWAVMGGLGALVGMAAYVGRISEGASYLSDDPKTCVNCHIMAPEYATWQHSSHGQVATCNDCHVPHSNVFAKYYYKAKDGSRHSYLFTLRRERQVIQAIPESRKVIQENCLRCHQRVLDEVTPQHGDFDRACTDCHREVPHGRVHSLTATPNASFPPLSPVAPEWLFGGRR